jgi:predicted RNase H-like HicB family nuclease
MDKERIKQVEVEAIKEKDGSYAIACSTLGVYTVGQTLAEAKRNFFEALDLHLSVIREQARKSLARNF